MTANLTLSKALYEATGWEYYQAKYRKNGFLVTWGYMSLRRGEYPAYSTDYLLDKLPEHITVAVLKDVVHHKEDGKKWITNRYSAHNLGAIKSGWCDTAADALCKLALQLKNEGLI